MDEETQRITLVKTLALELLVIDLLSARYLTFPDPAAAAAQHREHMRNLLSAVAVPGLDAALSDLAIGEIGDAMDMVIENAGDSAKRAAERGRR